MKRIAVVSDFHCHSPVEEERDIRTRLISTSNHRTFAFDHPIDSLKRFIDDQSLWPVTDLLLFAGDFTDRINLQGMTSGPQYLLEIKEILGGPPTVFTFGNHDIDTRPSHPKLTQGDAAVHAKNVPWLSFKGNEKHDFWANGFLITIQNRILILNINSVSGVNTESVEFPFSGRIDQAILENIYRQLNAVDITKFDCKILMCHHHPLVHEIRGLGVKDVMENGELLLKLAVENSFDLVVHGHKHHARLRYHDDESTRLAVFSSGSFAALPTGHMGEYSRNLFHVIEITGKSRGRIRTWFFRIKAGWSQSIEEMCDFPHATGFGSSLTTMEIARAVRTHFDTNCIVNLKWDKCLEVCPELDYLIPSEQKQLGRDLKSLSLELMYTKENTLPRMITSYVD